ncbi:MAG: HDOD domain-containing protein [Nitrospinales bacterium]
MTLNPRDLVNESTRLSSLPEICFKIDDIVADPQSSFEDVADVISNDTSLSARLLKIVNSALYNFPDRVETIIHAISIVGTQQLRDLVMATYALSAFKGIPEKLINMSSFWRHSVACGVAARVLAIHRREANAERFYLMGMLHDVGRLILLENAPDLAGQVILRAREKDEIMYKVELELLGCDHAAVGAELLRAWQVPIRIVEAVACHHDPSKAVRYPVESSVIHLADFIAKAIGLGCSGDRLVPWLNENAWEKVGLSTSQLPSIWDQVERQYNDTVEMFLSMI